MLASRLRYVILFSIIYTQSETKAAASRHWSYTEEKWKGICENGKEQSPIALSETMAEQKTFFPFIFDDYFREDRMATIKNNGHSVEIRFDYKPKIEGGGLPEVYVLDHLHFHWDSEHTINKIRFPLELHLVFHSIRRSSLADALKERGEVAVLAVLYYINAYDYLQFEPLTGLLNEVQNNNNKTKNLRIKIDNYLPRDKAGFYRYNGSLTTPDCTEGLIWTIFTNPIPISKRQVDAFRLLQTEENKFLKINYRPLQQLNKRRIFLQKSGPPGNIALICQPGVAIALMTVILIFV